MDLPSKTDLSVVDSFGPSVWRPWEMASPYTDQTFDVQTPTNLRIKPLSYITSPYNIKSQPGVKWTKKCPNCDELFTRRDNLTRHVKTKHDKVIKPSCIFCTKSLSRPDALARHIKTCQRNPSRGRFQTYSSPSSPSHDSPQDLRVGRASVIVSPPPGHFRPTQRIPCVSSSDTDSNHSCLF